MSNRLKSNRKVAKLRQGRTDKSDERGAQGDAVNEEPIICNEEMEEIMFLRKMWIEDAPPSGTHMKPSSAGSVTAFKEMHLSKLTKEGLRLAGMVTPTEIQVSNRLLYVYMYS